jgi:hypothetical protein
MTQVRAVRRALVPAPRVTSIAVIGLAAILPMSAHAQTAAPPAAPEAPPPGLWIDGVHLSAQIEGGITFNPANPDDGLNFGQLFTDRANQPLLNQVLLTASKPLDPKASGIDWGFTLQVMYGSDARYTHFLGELDKTLSGRNQLDVVQANVMLHLPYLTEGGIDIKAGQYTSPIGYEGIDPSGNPFYSHSYLFNFAEPLKHTGILTTTHVNSLLDLYLSVDSGVNTSLGDGDNNGAAAVLFGFGLNMLDGNLTLLALSHIGPENPTRVLSPLGYNANGYMRYLNDVVLTWKASDKLTLVTEAAWIRDDFDAFFGTGKPGATNAFGAAQYASYTLTDTVTLNARGEVFRDGGIADSGFWVAAYPGNLDPVNAEEGFSNGSFTTTAPTTYSEITVGVTYKPNLPAPITGLLIRPEIRWDSALNGTKAFDDGTRTNAFTIAADFVLTF